MKTKIFIIAFLVIIAIIGCNKQNSNEIQPQFLVDRVLKGGQDNPGGLSNKRCVEILSSNEAKQVFKKRSEFLQYLNGAFLKGTSVEDLKALSIEALQSEVKEKQWLELVFGDVKSGKSFIQEFENAIKASNSKFPEIAAINEGLSVDMDASIDNLFNNFAGHFEVENNMLAAALPPSDSTLIDPDSTGTGGDPDPLLAGLPPCGNLGNRIKLYACATLVGASTGGLGSALGLWACWCLFCDRNSAVADLICPRFSPDSIQ
jgi:hypothetical protein